MDYLLGFLRKDTNFYYLSLILENEEENKWSIHGLWPQYSKNEYPKYCKKVEFKIEKLESIIEELNKKWYSNIEKNNDFWKHEYEKHGSCMFTDISEFDYFNLVLNLYKEAIQLNLPNKCLIVVFKIDP